MECMDKCKEYGIRLEKSDLLKLLETAMEREMKMTELNPEHLNSVYREICEKMGPKVTMEIYQMFKGQQICFPVRFFNPARIHQIIIEEYDGTNVRALATKYNYSEKTIRRIVRKSLEE